MGRLPTARPALRGRIAPAASSRWPSRAVERGARASRRRDRASQPGAPARRTASARASSPYTRPCRGPTTCAGPRLTADVRSSSGVAGRVLSWCGRGAGAAAAPGCSLRRQTGRVLSCAAFAHTGGLVVPEVSVAAARASRNGCSKPCWVIQAVRRLPPRPSRPASRVRAVLDLESTGLARLPQPGTTADQQLAAAAAGARWRRARCRPRRPRSDPRQVHRTTPAPVLARVAHLAARARPPRDRDRAGRLSTRASRTRVAGAGGHARLSGGTPSCVAGAHLASACRRCQRPGRAPLSPVEVLRPTRRSPTPPVWATVRHRLLAVAGPSATTAPPPIPTGRLVLADLPAHDSTPGAPAEATGSSGRRLFVCARPAEYPTPPSRPLLRRSPRTAGSPLVVLNHSTWLHRRLGSASRPARPPGRGWLDRARLVASRRSRRRHRRAAHGDGDAVRRRAGPPTGSRRLDRLVASGRRARRGQATGCPGPGPRLTSRSPSRGGAAMSTGERAVRERTTPRRVR